MTLEFGDRWPDPCPSCGDVLWVGRCYEEERGAFPGLVCRAENEVYEIPEAAEVAAEDPSI